MRKKNICILSFLLLVFIPFFLLNSEENDIKASNSKIVNEFLASIPGNIAELNGQKIGKFLLVQELLPLINAYKKSPKKITKDDIEKLNQTAKSVLNQLIERQILLSLAKQDNFTVTQREIDEQFAKIANTIEGGENNLVNQLGITKSLIKKRIEDSLLIEKWLQNKLIPALTPVDTEIEDFYRKSQDLFLIPERLTISHIFLSTENHSDKDAIKKLENFRKIAKNSETFKKIAEENSEDERTKKNGGALGEYALNELPKPFADALSKVPEGEISAPFKSLRGWHIVRVDKKTKERYISEKEAYPVIKKILTEKKLNAKLKELIEKEKKDRKCIIYF